MDSMSTAEQPRDPLSSERLEASVRDLFEEEQCPGASVAVIDGTETVLTAGFGDRQIDPQAPATPETLYGIGSSTKPITATAVMTLVEDGAISLTDPVSEHVPYFEDAPGEPILVEELLSHTSGMPSDDITAHILMEDVFDADLDRSVDGWDAFREYVEESVNRRLVGDDRCLYYNSGYIVLSRLIETVTGTAFPKYVETNVFDPLGMDRSTFDVSVLEDDSRDSMTPYYEESEELRATGFPDSPLFHGPGGVQTSVTDLAKFLTAWNRRDLPFDTALAEDMFDPIGTFRTLADGSEINYGYGWMTRPFGDDTLVGHGGGTGVSAGYLGFLKERGLGVAIGCNAQPDTTPETLAMKILATAMGVEPSTAVPSQTVEQRQKQLTGRYSAYGGLQDARVLWNGDYLRVEYNSPMGTETMRIIPASLGPTNCSFRKVTSSATQTDIEFFIEDEGIRLLIARNLFERVADLETEDRQSQPKSI